MKKAEQVKADTVAKVERETVIDEGRKIELRERRRRIRHPGEAEGVHYAQGTGRSTR